MHGQNKVRPFSTLPPGSLQVHEIWYTIQGEGPFFGMPAVFIRLTGCNLQCHFCDTEWNDDGDPYLDIPDIIASVLNLAGDQTKLVVLTGGEPARQPLWLLIDQLKSHGFHTQLETAGSYWQPCFTDESVTLVCSPKTKHVHPKFYEHCKHWKYVIRTNEIGEDGLPSRPTQLEDFGPMLDTPINYDIPIEKLQGVANQIAEAIAGYDEIYQKFGPPAKPPQKKDTVIWLSPCDEGDPYATQQNMLLVGKLSLEFGYRAQVQLHKLLQVD
jgi:7-carboxy-7-deazaguanine synthase